MIKRLSILFLSLTLFFTKAIGRAFKTQFDQLISAGDTLGQQKLLEKWQKADNNDPELFVAYFNFYIFKSRNAILALGQNPNGKEALAVNKDSNTVGYLYDSTYYEPDLLQKGFGWIDKGIEKYPNRLDMRFGEIYMFGQIKDYKTFTSKIIKAIDYSAANKNQWVWANNKPLDSPKVFMLSSIQDYQVQLYNTGNDKLLDDMKKIAETVLKYYPNDIDNLSNLAIVFLLHKQYDKALNPLLKAEKLNPKDFIVLSNIAQTYKLKGDNKNAVKYYNLTLKYGDEQAKKNAQAQIAVLNKK